MGRITKDPAVRRQELVLAAGDLFKEKGFEQVSVSDIVRKVGVAQGTFYYYFKTKYDILDAVIDLYIEETMTAFNGIAADPALNAIEKLQAVVNFSMRIDEREKNFIQFLHTDENLITHQKYMMRSFDMAIPPITTIVEEGVQEGLFAVRYPRETVPLMVYMYGYLQDFLAMSGDRDEFYRKMRAAEDIFVKVLGIKDGAIRLVE